MMFDFWNKAGRNTCVHPEDLPVLESQKHKFVLDIPPGHIAGPVTTAPVIALFTNPGIGTKIVMFMTIQRNDACY